MNVILTFEKYAEADDNLLLCAVQEIDDLCTEDKNTEIDYEGEEAAACKPVPMCSEPMKFLDTYHHFLSSNPSITESTIRNLWQLENFTSNLF
jgi:hypothetical protein